MNAVARRKRSLLVLFFIPGLAFASWVTRTPEIRAAVDATVAEMGLILFGLSVGAIGGVVFAGSIVSRLGTKATMLVGLVLVLASMLTLATSVIVGDQLIAACGLGFFGLGMGMAEIAINLDGADLEQQSGTHLLHTLHGSYSLGTLIGSLIGFGMTAIGVTPVAHLFIIGGITVLLVLLFQSGVRHGVGKSEPIKAELKTNIWADWRLRLIAFLAFAMALAEGSAQDWLPILVVDEHGFSIVGSSLVYVGFTAAMTIGRFSGGLFLHKFGRAAVMGTCTLLVAIGIAIMIFGEGPYMIGLAVVLWGAGASLGFPLALSAAGEGGPGSAARVKAVAIVGYTAILVAPPALGFLGEHYGLSSALLVVLALMAVAIPMAKSASELR